nr:hypothetical protein [uncultured Mediterranean phage uvMED]
MTFVFGVLAGVVLTTLVLAFDPSDDLYEDEYDH